MLPTVRHGTESSTACARVSVLHDTTCIGHPPILWQELFGTWKNVLRIYIRLAADRIGLGGTGLRADLPGEESYIYKSAG